MKRSLLAILLLCSLVSLFLLSTLSAQTPPDKGQQTKEKEQEKAEDLKKKEPHDDEAELKKEEAKREEERKEDPVEKPSPEEKPDQESLADKEKKDAEEKKEEEKPKWDVNNPPGPFQDVPIDTDQGTWMSLDVSPDGREIVFDLLGDLYSIPMSGGQASTLTAGVAWDMQPRFSPNGRYIAFTSDRAGGDNIWIMKRDGSDPQQVTKEDFRLLNSPAWTPDSEFIVARKHFTSTRSLGAGEMWLYHRSGGTGVQLTKKPNDQKDAGEPVFSPDGRYLYFSQDTTPGPVFEYNKNSNGEIYVIQRLDRETGEIERYITGAGGSVRPTPSHDGRSIAFVRRVRTKSVLYLADLESGAERPLFDGLDRDMQETWAIHGVYPAMAWTPNDEAIVFWAAGKIHRVDVATRQISNIPFHVKDTRKVFDAVRFPVNVAPANVDAKMLRWVTVSPLGNQVVYQAFGHLYIRDLPSGQPRRLTSQTEHFEFYPSYSRDGKSIVYTTWDDEKFGTIRIASSRGGEGRVTSRNPGHYLEPVFSPDGRNVVYRTTTDGFMTTAKWSRDPGIYVSPAVGGEAKLVTRRGVEPQFGAAADRVYLRRTEEEKAVLASIELDGSDERVHYAAESATSFAVSPDEKWLAFTEEFNAYIAPFVKSGIKLEIGPKADALPLAKVSRDAGNYLHWSGDSRTLHWSLGPELFSRSLRESFKFFDGAPEELPGLPERGIGIGITQAADVPSGSVALVGGRIITMRGDEVIEDGTVVVERNRITAVGPRQQVGVPPGSLVIDVSGKTIMPGLIDVHWHGGMGNEDITPEQNWFIFAALAFGVTTIHDPSNSTSEIFATSEMARAGMITAPRIFSTGTVLYGAKASFKAVVNSLEDARSHLRRMKAAGAFSVKSYNQPRRDQRQQVIAAARELEMMVVPEGGSLFQHNMSMIVDGHTGVEHSIPVARIYKDTVQLWSASKTGYTPTLVVGYGGIWGENYWYQKTNVWENQRLLTFVPREIIDERARRGMLIAEDEFNHFHNARIASQLVDSGVSVQVGAHGQREGLGAHWEMWMFEQGGMSRMEALRSATLSGAKYLGLDRDIGSVERGKLADLIVLARNPLKNLRDSESVVYTMVNGRLYDATTMHEIGNHPRKRRPFFWEDGSSSMPVGTRTHD